MFHPFDWLRSKGFMILQNCLALMLPLTDGLQTTNAQSIPWQQKNVKAKGHLFALQWKWDDSPLTELLAGRLVQKELWSNFGKKDETETGCYSLPSLDKNLLADVLLANQWARLRGYTTASRVQRYSPRMRKGANSVGDRTYPTQTGLRVVLPKPVPYRIGERLRKRDHRVKEAGGWDLFWLPGFEQHLCWSAESVGLLLP